MPTTARAARRFRAAPPLLVSLLVSLLATLLAAAPRVAAGQGARRRAAAAAADTTGRALSLGDAARLAARQSAAAEEARLRAEQAGARVTQRRADLLPSFSATALQSGHTLNTATFGFNFPSPPGQPPILDPAGELIGPVNTIDLRAHASMSLFDVAAAQRVRAARASAQAFDADAASAAEQAGAAAAAAYLRTQRADAEVAARAADSALAADLLGIARSQLRAGTGIALDVTRAEAQLAQVRAQLIGARNERDRARLELTRALGLPLDAPIVLTDSLARLPVVDTLPSEADAVALALRRRPDLRAADDQAYAAERQVAAIRAERLPALAAFGDEGTIGTYSGNKLNTYEWGVQLSLPLFDGLRREARIEEQQALAREIDVRRRDTRQQAAVEVRGALLDLAAARQQVDAARERLRLAEQEVQQARERFSAGVAGNADVITASLSLNAARTQVIDVLTGYQSARVGLARATGSVTTLP